MPVSAEHEYRAITALLAKLNPLPKVTVRITRSPRFPVHTQLPVSRVWYSSLQPLPPHFSPRRTQRDRYTYVYPNFAFQATIAREAKFQAELDAALEGSDGSPPRRHPLEKYRYASVIRQERDKIQLSVVTHLARRRKYIMQHCELPRFDDPVANEENGDWMLPTVMDQAVKTHPYIQQ